MNIDPHLKKTALSLILKHLLYSSFKFLALEVVELIERTLLELEKLVKMFSKNPESEKGQLRHDARVQGLNLQVHGVSSYHKIKKIKTNYNVL